MVNLRLKSDTIQFWIMVTGLIALLGGMVTWAEGRFALLASVESVQDVSKRVDTEVEERRELKTEVDGIYQLIVPRTEQIQIKHPGSVRKAR